MKEEYLDVYERIHSEILSTAKFDENSDLGTTYLGRVNTTKTSKIKTKASFLILEQGRQWEHYWIEQNVKYYWIQELVSLSCLSHTICTVNHLTCYQSLH